jgi:nitrogen fixation/metabolism regulation signal transduction histidine kinase
MGSSRFRTGMALRATALFATLALIAWMLARTHWYVSIALGMAAVVAQFVAFMRYASASGREVARFLDAVAFDDPAQSFAGLRSDAIYRELGGAMAGVLDRLRASRAQREEQARYLQTVLSHVPVALISVDEQGRVQLLNVAARRLFETPLTDTAQFARHGEDFATGLDALQPGSTAIVRMERSSSALLLKAATTGFSLAGDRRRLISLQNIETELSAQELDAWQTVIRVMAHEVMNSLTPVSSLTATAHDLVRGVVAGLPADDPNAGALKDASEALETVARRSEGLLHFVQNHRRLTKRLVTRIEVSSVRRIFARLRRLLANDMAARNIRFTIAVEPETLEIAADLELLDQALINLVHNAIEALNDRPDGEIRLSAHRDLDGRVIIAVSDNGAGIAPAQREKIFVPFFTTKRQGSGVGLTLVRQIAAVHSATVDVSETPGGGATISMRF